MASNRGTVPLKLIETKCIRPLEIVLDGFGKYNPPVIKKLPVEVDIPEWLCMKGLEKQATDHEQEISYWEFISSYFLLRIGEYTITSDNKQMRQF